MKWFKLFELKRKLMVLCPDEGFFELHSRATEREKDKIWVQNGNFLANLEKFKPLRSVHSTYYECTCVGKMKQHSP